jgi:hypothetical protein
MLLLPRSQQRCWRSVKNHVIGFENGLSREMICSGVDLPLLFSGNSDHYRALASTHIAFQMKYLLPCPEHRFTS